MAPKKKPDDDGDDEGGSVTNVTNVTNLGGGDSWLKVGVDLSFGLSLTWIFGLSAGSALLCLGSPDLLDALVAAISALAR
jgi:hypothetical protein